MKKNATNAVIKMLGTIAIAVAATFSPAFCQTSSPDADINTYTLSVSADLYAQFRLPKDIRSGDVITGSVIEEKKAAASASNKISSTLEGVVIEIEGKQTKLSNRLFSFIVPAGIASIPFLLKNAAGQIINHGQVPVGGPMYDLLSDLWWREPIGGLFTTAQLSQPGSIFSTAGPFDGNGSNTSISLNGQPMEIIAENPRMNFSTIPQNAAAGISNLSIEDQTKREEHKLNIAVLSVSSDKLSLTPGEKAKVKVSVSGLGGLTGKLKLSLENQSPETVAFVKEHNTIIVKNIDTRSVKNGIYEFSTTITAMTAGIYAIGAKLTQPDDGGNPCVRAYLDCLKEADKAYDAGAQRCKAEGRGEGAAATCLAPYEKERTDAQAACLKKYQDCGK